MNRKAHERISALKARVDAYIIEVENNFISYAYEDYPLPACSSVTARRQRGPSVECSVCPNHRDPSSQHIEQYIDSLQSSAVPDGIWSNL